MKTVQQIIDELLIMDDKSQSISIWCGNRATEIGAVTSDDEGVYLEPEGE